MSRRPQAIVQRIYEPEAESCERALTLLLIKTRDEKRAVSGSRPDDVRKVQDAHTASSITSEHRYRQ